MNTRHAVIDSPLGELTLVSDGAALVGLYFRHHWHRPPTQYFGTRIEADSDDVLAATQRQLTEYLTGERTDFDIPIRLGGDPTHRRVWQRLTTIPCGQTVTYGQIATELADGTTAQEVGAMVGRNPISIVVPCHRVVGKNGKLTGYAGGLQRKQFLLDLEEPAELREARLF